MTPYEAQSHRITVLTTSQERWNATTRLPNTEFTYHFLLDGEDCGFKVVDGGTRQHLLKELFEISDLARRTSAKNMLSRIEALGKSMYALLVPDALRRKCFEAFATGTLAFDTPEQDIPWELLHDGTSFVASRFAIGRDIPSPKRRTGFTRKGLYVCLIGNPNSDLPAADIEIEELRELFDETLSRLRANFDIDTGLKVIQRHEAVKRAVLFEVLLSGNTPWDIIHFAGHGNFDFDRPSSSGLHLTDGDLKGFEVEEMKVRPVFFANACRSSTVLKDSSLIGYGLMRGLAPSFLKGGATGYVGTLWPVADEPARRVASIFYRSVIDGATIGEAMLTAKQQTASEFPNHPTPIGYILFGDPSSRLSIYEPQMTAGPYINDVGFLYVVEIEREFQRLEMLLANDLPWIFWRDRDFMNWVNRIPVPENRRTKMLLTLLDYKRYFRQLVTSGQKTLKAIVNLKTLRSYLLQTPPELIIEFLAEAAELLRLPNVLLLCYEGEENEIEEIEIVSKNDDPFVDLRQSVYVFNKQTRFEKNMLTYNLYAEFNSSLIKEYADRFFRYLDLAQTQYQSRFGDDYPSNCNEEEKNVFLNELTMRIIRSELPPNYADIAQPMPADCT